MAAMLATEPGVGRAGFFGESGERGQWYLLNQLLSQILLLLEGQLSWQLRGN